MAVDYKLLKDMRKKGASVKVQEDVAAYLAEASGIESGYDSPVFLPTIDFILKIQNVAIEVSQTQEKSKDSKLDLEQFNLPKTYDPNAFDKISLKGTVVGVSASDKIADNLKEDIMNYLDNIEIQRAKHLGILGLDPDEVDSDLIYTKARKNIKGIIIDRDRKKSLFRRIIDLLQRKQVQQVQESSRNQENQRKLSMLQRIRQQMRRVFRIESQRRASDRREDSSDEAERMLNKKSRNNPHLHDEHEHEHGSDDKAQKHLVESKEQQELNSKNEKEQKISQEIDKIVKDNKEMRKMKEMNRSEGKDNQKEQQQKEMQKQTRQRQTRLRVQQQQNRQRDQMAKKQAESEAQDNRVSKMSVKDAVASLKSSGVHAASSTEASRSNKDLSNAKKDIENNKQQERGQ